jgi:hypothetical protein
VAVRPSREPSTEPHSRFGSQWMWEQSPYPVPYRQASSLVLTGRQIFGAMQFCVLLDITLAMLALPNILISSLSPVPRM